MKSVPKANKHQQIYNSPVTQPNKKMSTIFNFPKLKQQRIKEQHIAKNKHLIFYITLCDLHPYLPTNSQSPC